MRIPKSTTKQVPDYVISLLHIIKLKVRHTTLYIVNAPS
jgi:hypothetical protein